MVTNRACKVRPERIVDNAAGGRHLRVGVGFVEIGKPFRLRQRVVVEKGGDLARRKRDAEVSRARKVADRAMRDFHALAEPGGEFPRAVRRRAADQAKLEGGIVERVERAQRRLADRAGGHRCRG